MKSSYELAMERLAKADPKSGKPLTSEQKAQLAAIDRLYKGKVAEREIFLRQHLDQAVAARNAEEVQKIKSQMSSELARLEDERETEKEKIRESGKT